MTTIDPRPSRSDAKPIYRHVLCSKCGQECVHKLTGPFQWTCSRCKAVFEQNPWVTDSHPIIEEPTYTYGGTKCANEPEDVRFVKVECAITATAPVVNDVILQATAQSAAVQASFL